MRWSLDGEVAGAAELLLASRWCPHGTKEEATGKQEDMAGSPHLLARIILGRVSGIWKLISAGPFARSPVWCCCKNNLCEQQHSRIERRIVDRTAALSRRKNEKMHMNDFGSRSPGT